MPALTITEGPHGGTTLEFNDTVVIGRGAAADLSVADPGLSRRHVRLRLDEGRWVIEDLGSANGTRVNGRKVLRPTRLRHGDVVELGFVRATYSAGVEHDDNTAPVDPEEPISTAEVLFALPVSESGEHELPAGTVATPAPGIPAPRLTTEIGQISDLVFDQQALVAFAADQLLTLITRADRVFVMLWDVQRSRLEPAAVAQRTPASAKAVPSSTLLEDVVASREARLVLDTDTDARYASAESMHAIGVRTAIGVPIIFQGEIHGAIQADRAGGGMALNRDDLAMSLSLAAQVGMALGYARLHQTLVERELLEHDLELARKLQHHFLPQEPPRVPGYDFAFECQSALAVGGDFFDFLELAPGKVAIVIGDVSGKGVSAALYAAKLASDLRYQAMGQTSPSKILERTNRIAASRQDEGMFATAAVVVLDGATGIVDMASAGHPLPLLRTAAGEVKTLGELGNTPLGIDSTATFAARQRPLATGDTLVLYTDGVTEALNASDRMFGDDRLRQAVRDGGGVPAEVVQKVRADIRQFVGAAPQSDDVTIVCVRRAG